MHSWLVSAWILFVTVLSLAPLNIKQGIGTQGALHNYAHFGVFAVTAALFAQRRRRISMLLLAFCATVGFGIVVETLQCVLYGNAFEWRDVAVDSFGALAGSGLAIGYLRASRLLSIWNEGRRSGD